MQIPPKTLSWPSLSVNWDLLLGLSLSLADNLSPRSEGRKECAVLAFIFTLPDCLIIPLWQFAALCLPPEYLTATPDARCPKIDFSPFLPILSFTLFRPCGSFLNYFVHSWPFFKEVVRDQWPSIDRGSQVAGVRYSCLHSNREFPSPGPTGNFYQRRYFNPNQKVFWKVFHKVFLSHIYLRLIIMTHNNFFGTFVR